MLVLRQVTAPRNSMGYCVDRLLQSVAHPFCQTITTSLSPGELPASHAFRGASMSAHDGRARPGPRKRDLRLGAFAGSSRPAARGGSAIH
eukprot:41116-Eustigmatos_ZCMA.PRE.1